MDNESMDAVSHRMKMEAFHRAVVALCKQLDFKGAVFHIQLNDEADASMYWPGCTPNCDHKELCAAKVFYETSCVLKDRSVEILQGSAKSHVVSTSTMN